MASIIDNHLFKPLSFSEMSMSFPQQDQTWQKIAKIVKITEETIHLPDRHLLVHAATRLRLPYSDFLLRVAVPVQESYMRSVTCLMEGSKYWRAHSKQTEILMVRELLNWQGGSQLEASFHVNKGRAVLTLNNFLVPLEASPEKIAQFYHRILSRNMLNFEDFLQGQLRVGRRGQLRR